MASATQREGKSALSCSDRSPEPAGLGAGLIGIGGVCSTRDRNDDASEHRPRL